MNIEVEDRSREKFFTSWKDPLTLKSGLRFIVAYMLAIANNDACPAKVW